MAAPINIPANISISTTSLNRSTRQVQQALGRITGQASEFQKSLDASTARVFAFGATTAVLQAVNQSFKKLISTTVEVEKKLIEINSIFQATNAQFSKFRDSIFQVAKDTGQSFNTVAEGAAELARQGLSAEETAKRLKAALILTRISGMDAEKSVKSLTAAMNGFTSAGLSAEQIVNKIVAVDTAFAVSAQDLADGFSRAGSTAEDAGVSFDQLLGLITAVEQRTARGGAVIGNAFKSIFTRLARGTTIEKLKELGVEIDSSQTGIQKLQSLSAALEKISDPTIASQIKELAGGVFQINVVSSTLKDLSSETSIFASAAKEASNATNEAFQKNELLNTSLAAQINSLVAGITNLAEKIGGITIAPLLGNLVKIATVLSDSLDGALDPEKGNAFIKGLLATISSFISGPGLIMVTVAFLKITKLVAKFAMDGFKSVMAIGSAQEKNKQIEAGIVRLLQHDVQLRKQLANQSLSQAQKEQAVLDAIKRENALLRDQERLMRNLTSLARQRGVTGHSSSRGFKGRGFSAGHMQEEANARMLGATSSVRAHRGQGTIGGKSFIMNNQETEIPNFGRNGDSAVIPHYAKGFVPNFAMISTSAYFNKKGASLRGYTDGIKNGTIRRTEVGKDRVVGDVKFSKDEINAAGKLGIDEKGKQADSKKKQTIDASRVIGKNTMPTVLTPSNSGGTRSITTRKDFNHPVKFQFKSFKVDKNGKLGLRKDFDRKFSDTKIKEMAENTALKFAKKAAEAVSEKPVDPKTIEEVDNVNGFISGIKGGFGGIFDAALTTALRTNVGDGVGGDFDVNTADNAKAKSNVRKIFGSRSLPLSGLADYKINDGNYTLESMITKFMGTKILTDPIKATINKQKVDRKGLNRVSKGRGRAGGFIPNYSQTDRGVPMSKIRAHFDGAGNPVAVTNTMDEPNGLSDVRKNGLADAIGRERQGIGMHSEGFVPNFRLGGLVKLGGAAGRKIGAGASRLFGGAKNKGKNVLDSHKASKANIKSLKENTKKLKKENQEIQKRISAGKLSKEQLKIHKKKLKKNNSKISDNASQMQNDSGAGMLAMFALSGVDTGFQALADSRREKGDEKGGMLADQGSAAAQFASMGAMFGPMGMAIGAVTGQVYSLGSALLDANKRINEGEKKGEKLDKGREAQAKGIQRQRSAMRSLGFSKGNEVMEVAQKVASVGLRDYTDEIKKVKDRLRSASESPEEYKKATDDYIKVMEKVAIAETKVAEIKRIQVSLTKKQNDLIKLTTTQAKASQARVKSAQKAVDTLGFMSEIRTPELTGERKNAIDRSLKGQSAVAGAQLNKQTVNDLKVQLSQAKDQDKKDEIGEKIKQATKVFEDSVVSAAISLRNNLNQAEFDLGKLKETLTKQKEQTFESRLGFVDSLKGKTLNADVVRDNVRRLREAGDDPQRKLEAMQRLAGNQKQLDAINPAIFKGILDAMNMTADELEKVSQGIKKEALKSGGITDQKTLDAIIERLKKDGPDITNTQKEIEVLEASIKDSERQIDKFGKAFNAEKISASTKLISDALEKFGEGMGDGSKILEGINSANTKAATQIAKSNALVEEVAKDIVQTKKDIISLRAAQTQIRAQLEP